MGGEYFGNVLLPRPQQNAPCAYALVLYAHGAKTPSDNRLKTHPETYAVENLKGTMSMTFHKQDSFVGETTRRRDCPRLGGAIRLGRSCSNRVVARQLLCSGTSQRDFPFDIHIY